MTRFRARLILFVAFMAAIPLHAHIGSPAVVFDGAAGPYPVRVIILPPPVVPGRAEINVRLLEAPAGPVKVTVLPVNSRAGLKGAPAPDEATAVAGDPLLRHAELWLMTSGSYSVHVTVTGTAGAGTVIVPVVSIATRRLAMPPLLGALLGVLGAVLFASLVVLIGIGARDSVRPEDEPRTPRQVLQGIIASTVTVVVLAFAVYEGSRWWAATDRNYERNELYRPLPLTATYRPTAAGPRIRLQVQSDATQTSPRLQLIPDHGKLMHLFMVREPQLDTLAHLHPLRAGPREFEVAAPPLPPGTYRLYADVTYETGFAATLTTTLEIPAPTESDSLRHDRDRDPDDSWFIGAGPAAADTDVILSRGSATDLRAGTDLTLSFVAQDRAGHPVDLEPYMGMWGHAAIRRSDGSVFAHLHPVGTISMASQDFFQQAAARQTGTEIPVDHSQHLAHAAAASTVSFPYLFPQAGSYRAWIQTKSGGKIVTSVFDLNVSPAR